MTKLKFHELLGVEYSLISSYLLTVFQMSNLFESIQSIKIPKC